MRMLKTAVGVICILTVLSPLALSQRDYTTPVPILKQINRQNDDGSYSYGYEAADGSYKIETKYQSGEVYGKYGYVDDTGKLREVEYGASRRGFEPQGNDINVPPPTLKSNNPYPVGTNDIDDGQYHEDPRVYYKDQKSSSRPIPASNFRLDNFEPARPHYNPPPPPPPQPRYNPPPQPQYYSNPAPQSQRYQEPYYQQPSAPHTPSYVPNHHHPALRNIDIWSGSYSIDYTGR